MSAVNNDDGSNWEWLGLRDYLSALTTTWLDLIWRVLSSTCHFLTDKDQQKMRVVAEKPHDAVVKFDTYRNAQRRRAVHPAIARLLFLLPRDAL